MQKKLSHHKVGLLVLAIVSFMTCLPSYAVAPKMNFIGEDKNIVTPMFTNIAIFQNAFDISVDGRAEVMSYLSARNVTEVMVEAQLQQNKNGVWTTVKTWSSTSKGTNAGLEGSYYVLKGYKYRLVSKGKVYKNGSLVEETSSVGASKTY